MYFIFIYSHLFIHIVLLNGLFILYYCPHVFCIHVKHFQAEAKLLTPQEVCSFIMPEGGSRRKLAAVDAL